MKLIILTILTFSLNTAIAESWSPNPKFNIEGSNYEQTLTFISGISYSLTETNNELLKNGKVNFICNTPKIINSKLLVELLNKKHKGTISSEQTIKTILNGLKEKYPCN